MKKKFLIIFLVVIALFILSKIYQFIMVKNMYTAVENFRKQENRYYEVEVMQNEKIIRKEKILTKNQIFKYTNDTENVGQYCEWKNFETGEEYSFNFDNKKAYKGHISIQFETLLYDMPNFVKNINKKDKVDINSIFKVNYIIPTKYNDKICYKIVTKNEIIIIDKETYLPVYSGIKVTSSDKGMNNSTEYKYKFEVDNVTEEDMALPDLSQYEVIEKGIE